MKFRESTTSQELIHEFGESVMKLMDEMEESFEQSRNKGASNQILAVHTRKQILQWFFNNGGL